MLFFSDSVAKQFSDSFRSYSVQVCKSKPIDCSDLCTLNSALDLVLVFFAFEIILNNFGYVGCFYQAMRI